MCPISSDPFYLVTYYIKWVTVSWTDSRKYRNIKLIHMKEIELFLPFILALSPALFVYKYITVHGCLRSKACDKYLVILCKKLTYSNAGIVIYTQIRRHCPVNIRYIKGSRKKNIFLVVRPIRGGGVKACPLK